MKYDLEKEICSHVITTAVHTELLDVTCSEAAAYTRKALSEIGWNVTHRVAEYSLGATQNITNSLQSYYEIR